MGNCSWLLNSYNQWGGSPRGESARRHVLILTRADYGNVLAVGTRVQTFWNKGVPKTIICLVQNGSKIDRFGIDFGVQNGVYFGTPLFQKFGHVSPREALFRNLP